jgi:hypothetical protein
MDALTPTPPRRRGAPPGNHNALKHGFYTTRFKKADLTAYQTAEFTGLAEEIALLRIYIRRVVELGVGVDQLAQSINTLRALSLAIACLNRLVKTQVLLASSDDEISIAIREVLDELTNTLPLPAAPNSAAKEAPTG